MDYEHYQRPREKLQIKGVTALSFVELLQIILGSGSAKASGAKIARIVEKLLQEDKVTYDTLISTEGVGEAKACQILAVLEIARRFSSSG